MKASIIFCRNEFKLFDPKTWLSTIIRKVTKSNWNHCAFMYMLDNQLVVSDFQSHYKFRTFDVWKEETNNRTYEIVDIETITDLTFIKNETLFASGLYDGYEFRKLLSHFTYLKFGFKLFSENSKRFICSEWVEYLITGNKNNMSTPKSLYEKYFR